MKNFTVSNSKRWVLITEAIFIMLVAILSSCEKSSDTNNGSPAFLIRQSESLVIPAAIALPLKGTRVTTFYAKGVQRYKAQAIAGTTPKQFEWVLLAPEADLYDINNYKVGRHYAGPTWRLTGAYDSIVGQAFNPAKLAASPDANSIDWLQLSPKSGVAPTGVFSEVDFIQRITTVGGKKPGTAPTTEGQTIDMPYTAVYRFTKR